jgi:hypothetical protein
VELDSNTVLALAFGAWAGVVAWLGQGIRNDVKGIAEGLKDQSKRLNEYVVQTEARLARIEERIRG